MTRDENNIYAWRKKIVKEKKDKPREVKSEGERRCRGAMGGGGDGKPFCDEPDGGGEFEGGGVPSGRGEGARGDGVGGDDNGGRGGGEPNGGLKCNGNLNATVEIQRLEIIESWSARVMMLRSVALFYNVGSFRDMLIMRMVGVFSWRSWWCAWRKGGGAEEMELVAAIIAKEEGENLMEA